MGLFGKIKESYNREKARKKAYKIVYENEYRKAQAKEIRRTAMANARKQARIDASGGGGFSSKMAKIQSGARSMSNANLLGSPNRRSKKKNDLLDFSW